MSIIDYPFTEAELHAAADEWNCNCGPAALAFALRVKPDAVRHAIPDFETKGYTSPTMMKAALAKLGRPFDALDPAESTPCRWPISLTRVQFTGPWTAPGANARWAYWHTHWVATWVDMLSCVHQVFDCNGGIMTFERWEKEIVPLLTGNIKRADGGYFFTHIWKLRKEKTP